MNITQDRIDDLNAVITINLQPEDYKEEVKEELRKQARKAQMPGFRAGKVPMSLVKKMVGISVVIDTVSKKLQQELQDFISKEELSLLGEPLPTEKKRRNLF